MISTFGANVAVVRRGALFAAILTYLRVEKSQQRIKPRFAAPQNLVSEWMHSLDSLARSMMEAGREDKSGMDTRFKKPSSNGLLAVRAAA
jgi:hypothetical protein